MEEDVKPPAVTTGGCDDQFDADGSDRVTSQNTAASDGDADGEQLETTTAEGETFTGPEIQRSISKSGVDKSQPMLPHDVGQNDSNVEEVQINTRCKGQKTQKNTSPDNVTREQPEEQVIGQEQQRTTSARSTDTKTSPKDSNTAKGITAETDGKDTPIGTPHQQTSEPAADDDTRRQDLPRPPAPDGAAAAPAPRRWRTAEFLCAWRSALRSRGGGVAAAAALLRSVAPHQLPQVVGSELDSAMLSTVIR